MVRNVFHLGLGQVATTLVAILLSATVARALGASEFGLLYLVMTIGTFAYVFVDWGHAAYVTGEISRHPQRAGELIGTVMAVRAASALVVCVPVVATTWLLGYDLSTIALSVALILSWVPAYVAMSYSWVFRGCERMDYDAIINVVMKLSNLLLTVVCLALGGRVLSLILLSITAGAIPFILAIALYRRLELPPLRITRAAAYELLRGGAPLLAMSVTVAVQPYLNVNILHALTPREVVGWYGVAWAIGGTLLAPATILATGLYPRFAKAAANLGELRQVLRAGFRPLLFVGMLGAVGTYLFADTAVAIVYGKQKFGAAAHILMAFAPALFLIYLDMILGSALVASGRAGRLAIAKAATVVVTTAAGLMLTPLFQAWYGNGGIGIMLAMVGGELVMVITVIVMMREAIDKRLFTDLFRALIAGGLTIAAIRWLPITTAWVAIPACVLVFFLFSMVLGLVNRSDLEPLMATVRRRDADAPPAREIVRPTRSFSGCQSGRFFSGDGGNTALTHGDEY